MDKTDYESIKYYYERLERLKESGEIVNVYGGFEADAEEDSCPCPIEGYGKLIAETEKWIDDNEECIFDCYLEILLDNKNSLLAVLKEE